MRRAAGRLDHFSTFARVFIVALTLRAPEALVSSRSACY